MSKQNDRSSLDQEVSDWLKTNRVTRLRSIKKARTHRKAYANSLPACPDCGSKLQVGKFGEITCSGDKLNEWYFRFLEYEKSDRDGKAKIISEDKTGNFTELYERWLQKDANGNRIKLVCLYSNRLYPSTPHYEFYMLDALQIKSLEKKLKRPISKKEWTEGVVKYKDENSKQTVEEEIIVLRFPWDLV